MKTREVRSIFLLCAVSMFVLYSCSNRGDKNATEQSLEKNTPAVMIPPQVANTVIIKGMKFIPEELHVTKGDTVIWINKGIVAHNVTDFPGNKWASDTIAKSESWKKIIGETFDYYCSIHPTMKGKIIID